MSKLTLLAAAVFLVAFVSVVEAQQKLCQRNPPNDGTFKPAKCNKGQKDENNCPCKCSGAKGKNQRARGFYCKKGGNKGTTTPSGPSSTASSGGSGGSGSGENGGSAGGSSGGSGSSGSDGGSSGGSAGGDEDYED